MGKLPTQERAKRRVERMLDSFGQLVDQHGYENVTTTMVAEHSRSAVGSVYQFFRNRQDLAAGLGRSLRDWTACQTRANLVPLRSNVAVQGWDFTLEECYTALFQAMEAVHRNRPGARRMPMDALALATDLLPDFQPSTTLPEATLLARTTVAVATSSGCIKAALDNPRHAPAILTACRGMLLDLAVECA